MITFVRYLTVVIHGNNGIWLYKIQSTYTTTCLQKITMRGSRKFSRGGGSEGYFCFLGGWLCKFKKLNFPTPPRSAHDTTKGTIAVIYNSHVTICHCLLKYTAICCLILTLHVYMAADDLSAKYTCTCWCTDKYN